MAFLSKTEKKQNKSPSSNVTVIRSYKTNVTNGRRKIIIKRADGRESIVWQKTNNPTAPVEVGPEINQALADEINKAIKRSLSSADNELKHEQSTTSSHYRKESVISNEIIELVNEINFEKLDRDFLSTDSLGSECCDFDAPIALSDFDESTLGSYDHILLSSDDLSL